MISSVATLAGQSFPTMRSSVLSVLFAAAGSAWAQTPDGIFPQVPSGLTVQFGETIVLAGETIPIDVAQKQPTIGLPAVLPGDNEGKKFVLVMVADVKDLDANGPSNTRRKRQNNEQQPDDPQHKSGQSTYLHYLAANLTLTGPSFNGSTRLDSTGDPLAPYVAPKPITGGSHRYMSLVFAQPDTFTVPDATSAAIKSRAAFDLRKFLTDTGLQLPLWGNNFIVVSSTPSSSASTKASITGGSTRTSLVTDHSTTTFPDGVEATYLITRTTTEIVPTNAAAAGSRSSFDAKTFPAGIIFTTGISGLVTQTTVSRSTYTTTLTGADGVSSFVTTGTATLVVTLTGVPAVERSTLSTSGVFTSTGVSIGADGKPTTFTSTFTSAGVTTVTRPAFATTAAAAGRVGDGVGERAGMAVLGALLVWF
ncbi:PEBP-like protein [Trichodelitschia bisporula]|uniref:PEBP-like protein n=1 Tax=Trichodelitschia bisporula TaxID=703511 RepID=A0A6G1HTJ3_9PEZI|nr:PEBP-like protein [Trichodelitschia bisporula]